MASPHPPLLFRESTKLPYHFIHVDAYRLVDSENPNLYLDDLDLDIAGSITLIEWGGAESARLSEDRLEITIDRSDEVRKVADHSQLELAGQGLHYEQNNGN